jgi:hypothetical protein
MRVFPVQKIDRNAPTDMVLVDLDEGWLWRFRSCTVKGHFTGAAGTEVLTLTLSGGGLLTAPYSNGNDDVTVSATSSLAIGPNDSYAYTWSTETGDNYEAFNFRWGATGQLGFPLLWIPGPWSVLLEATCPIFAGTRFFVDDGFVQVEQMSQQTVPAG